MIRLCPCQVRSSYGESEMSGKSDRIYFDSCIFLAHLKNEQRSDPSDMAGVNDLVDKIDRGETHLATSVISLAEVLESSLSSDARDKFEDLWKRRNCHLVEVNRKIAEIAHNIRDYYRRQQQKDGLPTLSTPDAIHVATAISFDCERLYTFDRKDRPGKTRALIPLSPLVAGQYQLIIEKPTPAGGQLPLISR